MDESGAGKEGSCPPLPCRAVLLGCGEPLLSLSVVVVGRGTAAGWPREWCGERWGGQARRGRRPGAPPGVGAQGVLRCWGGTGSGSGSPEKFPEGLRERHRARGKPRGWGCGG